MIYEALDYLEYSSKVQQTSIVFIALHLNDDNKLSLTVYSVSWLCNTAVWL